jgi:hypothetical protein
MLVTVGTIASSNSSPTHFAVRVWQGSTRNKNTDPAIRVPGKEEPRDGVRSINMPKN